MFFRQYQLGCLSLFSYMIGDTSTGRAVVVDPQRDIAEYMDDAAIHSLSIERIIETHVHADFVSGHLELAELTGAPICYGVGVRTEFPVEELTDGRWLGLGDVGIEVRATPGHTPESISLVVYEQRGAQPWGVLTGDTLFIGDVGRPDLLTSTGHTADDLARSLYRSLRDKLLTLPDSTRVFPAHGAGSACGKALSTATQSTIGEQRRLNYALAPMTEERFVEVVTEGQAVPPAYFSYASEANRKARALLDEQAPSRSLTVEEVMAIVSAPTAGVVLDTRSPETFASGHLGGSINVALDGRFAEYAGDAIRPGRNIVLVAEPGRHEEARVRLARIGFDQIAGHLPDIDAVLAAEPELAETSIRLPAADLAAWRAERPDLQILDVRSPGEQAQGMVPGARPVPLNQLLDAIESDQFRHGSPLVVYCAGGYRSSIAASTLRAHGYEVVADILGGFGAWAAAGLTTE